jgi:hypothetical protein
MGQLYIDSNRGSKGDPYKKKDNNEMQFKLKQKEAQAIASACVNYFEEIDKLYSEKKLSTYWNIMYDDFKFGKEKFIKQYNKQLKEEV